MLLVIKSINFWTFCRIMNVSTIACILTVVSAVAAQPNYARLPLISKHNICMVQTDIEAPIILDQKCAGEFNKTHECWKLFTATTPQRYCYSTNGNVELECGRVLRQQFPTLEFVDDYIYYVDSDCGHEIWRTFVLKSDDIFEVTKIRSLDNSRCFVVDMVGLVYTEPYIYTWINCDKVNYDTHIDLFLIS